MPTLDYLTSVARAAEQAGFHSVLTPVGLGCPDPWVLCSAIAARTDRLGFIVAVRPSLASPTLLAQQADTFTRIHGRRLILNIVTGGDPVEQAAYGDGRVESLGFDRAARRARSRDSRTASVEAPLRTARSISASARSVASFTASSLACASACNCMTTRLVAAVVRARARSIRARPSSVSEVLSRA